MCERKRFKPNFTFRKSSIRIEQMLSKKINSHKKQLLVKTQNNFIFSFLGILFVLLYAMFFPAYESPDEFTHINRILNESNLWGQILNYVSSFFLDFRSLNVLDEVIVNDDFSFFNNDFLFESSFVPIEYYFLRIINASLLLTFFFLFVFIFKGNKLSIFWPSSTYYMSLLSSDGIAIALMLGSSSNTKIRIILLICLCSILFFIDRSILVFISFLLIKFIALTISNGNFKAFKKISIFIFFVSLLIYTVSIIDFNLFLGYDLFYFGEIERVMTYSQNLLPNHLNQLIVFIASFLILSGSMSFYPTIIYYLFSYYLIFNSLKFINKIKLKHDDTNEIFGTIFIGISVFLLVSSVAPQLSHFRYYLFIAPVFVNIFLYRYPPKYLVLLSLIPLIYNTFVLNLFLI